MILIVGGAGYIGSHTNKFLNLSGYETVVFDNFSRGHRNFVKWGLLNEGDLADIKQIRRCFQQHQIDAVMHFSAFAYVGESCADPHLYYTNNVSNTLNLLQVMMENNVDKLVFSSTCATYGIPEKIPIREDELQSPINPYGKSKLMIEQILQDYDQAYGLKSVCLRYFNAAGADPGCEIGEKHSPETHLIPRVIYAAMGIEKDISIFGSDYNTPDGTCIRDYIHVNDLADAHILALSYLKEKNISNQFNLGIGRGYSNLDVVEAVKEVSGKEFTVKYAPKRLGDPSVLISESEKARNVLGWEPEYEELNSIIQTAWKWHVQNNIYDEGHE
jgi:UDP-glucose 4-epimerase